MRPILGAAALLVLVLTVPSNASADNDLAIAPRTWRFVSRESGPTNYYSVVDDPKGPYLEARYRPPFKTAVMGFQIPDGDKRSIKKLRWTWRAVTLPKGGDECNSSKADSAAVVYVTFKRGLRYHTLKYVWSAVTPKGKTCDRKRNPFLRQDTVVLESGGPVGQWKTEEIDLAADYRRQFEGGDPGAEVPDLVGIGIMSDGDQTHSESAADYGTFILVR
jgi:hypothetical protein